MTTHESPNEINFGDLILVDGYGEEPFYVDGWTVETHYTPDEVWTETWYDITSAHTGEYSMAELSDVTRICGKEQAEEYLANSVRVAPVRIGTTQPTVYTSKIATRNPELVRQRAEDVKKAEIDGLLDEMNDYSALADAFGDEEYSEKIKQIKIRLSQIVEKKFIVNTRNKK